jgi:quercetin dioxygenase-like cupin family protein
MTTTQTAVHRTDLLKTALGAGPADGALELVAYTVELPAGFDAGRHRHTFSTMVYVLEGRYRSAVGEQGEQITEHGPGAVFSEPAGVVVAGRALEPTKLYVVLACQPGQPEARPA